MDSAFIASRREFVSVHKRTTTLIFELTDVNTVYVQGDDLGMGTGADLSEAPR